MDWTILLEGATAIHAIYGDHTPRLDAVSLHEVSLAREGPQLTLRMDLAEYPSSPPSKWAAQGFDTVQIQIDLFGLQSVCLENLSAMIIGDLAITREGGVISTRFDSRQMKLQAVSDFASLARISAHATE
ncbi:Imm50 family immunity protein [Streptomyces sp. NPDC054784]